MSRKADQYIIENKSKVVDKWRPRYHLSGECGWINDPNGFIRFKEMYHLFYQFHPYSSTWGPMHWGHAVSKDLVTWKYCDIALHPDENYDKDGCFSGSAIEKDDDLYLMYTGHVKHEENSKGYLQTQCLALSKDGLNFVKSNANPVIGTKEIPCGYSLSDFRDPRIFCRKGIYYVLIGSQTERDNGELLLYKSFNMIEWEFVNTVLQNNGSIGKQAWECPDIVSFDDIDILFFSAQNYETTSFVVPNSHVALYCIGKLDLEKGIFKGGNLHPLDYGFDFYAPQVLTDIDNAKIMTAWLGMWNSPYPTSDLNHNWAGSMILPRKLELRGDRLHFHPIKTIENYRSNEMCLDSFLITKKQYLCNGHCFELYVQVQNIDSKFFKIELFSSNKSLLKLTCNLEASTLELERNSFVEELRGICQTNLISCSNLLDFRIFVDYSLFEVFICDGEKVLSARIYPEDVSIDVCLYCDTTIKVNKLQKWDLMKGGKI